MAAKKKSTTTITLAGGNKYQLPDDLSIPEFLKRSKDEKPETTSVSSSTTTTQVLNKPVKSKHGLNKPMGMTDEEYEAALERFAPKEAPKPEKPKREKKARVPRAEAPKGTFKLSIWAGEVGLDARAVRRIARMIKSELSKLYVDGMKYVFKDGDKTTVAKMINDGFASETRKTIRAPGESKRKKQPKIPPPSETVWSGSAKKTKPAPAPKSIDPKAEARRVAKKAVKEHGKRNIVKVKARKPKK